MPPTDHFSQAYYRGELRAHIHCTGAGCGIEVAQPRGTACRRYRLELLLQPLDKAGWPRGRPRCLFETTIPLRDHGSGRYSRGYQRLPFLSRDALRQCHVRLTCATMSAAQSNPPDAVA